MFKTILLTVCIFSHVFAISMFGSEGWLTADSLDGTWKQVGLCTPSFSLSCPIVIMMPTAQGYNRSSVVAFRAVVGGAFEVTEPLDGSPIADVRSTLCSEGTSRNQSFGVLFNFSIHIWDSWHDIDRSKDCFNVGGQLRWVQHREYSISFVDEWNPFSCIMNVLLPHSALYQSASSPFLPFNATWTVSCEEPSYSVMRGAFDLQFGTLLLQSQTFSLNESILDLLEESHVDTVGSGLQSALNLRFESENSRIETIGESGSTSLNTSSLALQIVMYNVGWNSYVSAFSSLWSNNSDEISRYSSSANLAPSCSESPSSCRSSPNSVTQITNTMPLHSTAFSPMCRGVHLHPLQVVEICGAKEFEIGMDESNEEPPLASNQIFLDLFSRVGLIPSDDDLLAWTVHIYLFLGMDAYHLAGAPSQMNYSMLLETQSWLSITAVRSISVSVPLVETPTIISVQLPLRGLERSATTSLELQEPSYSGPPLPIGGRRYCGSFAGSPWLLISFGLRERTEIWDNVTYDTSVKMHSNGYDADCGFSSAADRIVMTPTNVGEYIPAHSPNTLLVRLHVARNLSSTSSLKCFDRLFGTVGRTPWFSFQYHSELDSVWVLISIGGFYATRC